MKQKVLATMFVVCLLVGLWMLSQWGIYTLLPESFSGFPVAAQIGAVIFLVFGNLGFFWMLYKAVNWVIK